MFANIDHCVVWRGRVWHDHGMRFLLYILFTAFFGTAARAQQVTYSFVWTGSGDYSVKGAFSFDEGEISNAFVFSDDVVCFEMTGFHKDQEIGKTSLVDMEGTQNWIFHFDHRSKRLLVHGDTFLSMPQAWNMGGRGNDCGEAGFGLNIGSAAQDICINNTLIYESQIHPSTPFPVHVDPDYAYTQMHCPGDQLLSFWAE
ncbi:MAG: hypothetical protein ACPG5U_08115 [Planktomarina sp.]